MAAAAVTVAKAVATAALAVVTVVDGWRCSAYGTMWETAADSDLGDLDEDAEEDEVESHDDDRPIAAQTSVDLTTPQQVHALDRAKRKHGRVGIGTYCDVQDYDGEPVAKLEDVRCGYLALGNCFPPYGRGRARLGVRARSHSKPELRVTLRVTPGCMV